MAYRRKQAVGAATLEEFRSLAVGPTATYQDEAAPSLAAQAMRASAAHRDASSLSSAYGEPVAMSAAAAVRRESGGGGYGSSPSPRDPDSSSPGYTSIKNLNEAKYGFWGTLSRKAKAFLDEDSPTDEPDFPRNNHPQADYMSSSIDNSQQSYQTQEKQWKREAPQPQRRSETITSSLNYIGGTIKNALEEGRTIVENKTAGIIQETRKLNIRRKGSRANSQGEADGKLTQRILPQNTFDYETQLKASRDVANAMAAKAKLLLRELKTFKADLAFAKERCAQLEEENRVLRESRENGDNPEDDDLIRLQLETLLMEKARLAHENSVYARENRFLREIVEYHQLTMQDVIYVDEGIEEVTEVYPTQVLPTSTPPKLLATGHSSSPAATTSVVPGT